MLRGATSDGLTQIRKPEREKELLTQFSTVGLSDSNVNPNCQPVVLSFDFHRVVNALRFGVNLEYGSHTRKRAYRSKDT